MAKLIYSALTSLDGYIEDEDGTFDWAEPDEEMHAFVNDLERPVGTYLYGRRMYREMVYWETVHTGAGRAAVGSMESGLLRVLRAIRHEHPRRDQAGDRRLPIGTARHHPRRPARPAILRVNQTAAESDRDRSAE